MELFHQWWFFMARSSWGNEWTPRSKNVFENFYRHLDRCEEEGWGYSFLMVARHHAMLWHGVGVGHTICLGWG